jgi:hypothetical protein
MDFFPTAEKGVDWVSLPSTLVFLIYMYAFTLFKKNLYMKYVGGTCPRKAGQPDVVCDASYCGAKDFWDILQSISGATQIGEKICL